MECSDHRSGGCLEAWLLSNLPRCLLCKLVGLKRMRWAAQRMSSWLSHVQCSPSCPSALGLTCIATHTRLSDDSVAASASAMGLSSTSSYVQLPNLQANHMHACHSCRRGVLSQQCSSVSCFSNES